MVKAITTTDGHDDAFSLYATIIAKKRHIEEVGQSIGEDLFKFQQRRMWRAMGFTSFNAFLADPNIDIAERTAQRVIRIHREYVVKILTPRVAAIENDYWPDNPPRVAQQEIAETTKKFKEQMAKVGTFKLDVAASYIDGRSIDGLMNTAMTLTRVDFQAYVKGIEPVYVPPQWRDLLHEARNACELLARCESAPTEVREFALDFWSATEARS